MVALIYAVALTN